MIQSTELEKPEDGIALTNRNGKRSKRKAAAAEAEADPGAAPAEELEALRLRIAELKKTRPRDNQPHCGDCFRRGYAAALDDLEELER